MIILQNVNIKLETFEGPIELLYHLIEKNKIDIYDIPIASLTEQYIAVIESDSYRNMDNISEFMVMAATLIEIKSKMLLPVVPSEEDEEDIDPRAQLVERLLEYKRFKNISEDLKDRQEKAALVFYKDCDVPEEFTKYREPVDINDVLKGVTIDDIYKAFREVMSRQENKVDRVRSGFKAVERDMFTVEEKMEYISDLLTLSHKVSFKRMFRPGSGKNEKVVTFLAILELIKTKKISFSQNELFGDIEITLYKEKEEQNEISRA